MHDLSSLAGKVWQWTKDHAADIAKVGNLLSKISSILGVIALVTAPFEPVGAIFGAAAALTSVGATAASGLAKAAGDKNVGWDTIGIDALGALPLLGSAAKVSQAGIDATTALSRADKLAKDLGLGEKAVDTTGNTIRVVGEGGSRLLVAGTKNFINGATIGSGGFNKAVGALAKFGPKVGLSGLAGLADKAIDPMSRIARGIDQGIDGAKTAGSLVYGALHGNDGSSPRPAGSTFSGVLRLRSAS